MRHNRRYGHAPTDEYTRDIPPGHPPSTSSLTISPPVQKLLLEGGGAEQRAEIFWKVHVDASREALPFLR